MNTLTLVLWVLVGGKNNPANAIGPLAQWLTSGGEPPVLALWRVRFARWAAAQCCDFPEKMLLWAAVEAMNTGSIPRFEMPSHPPTNEPGYQGWFWGAHWSADDHGGWAAPLRDHLLAWAGLPEEAKAQWTTLAKAWWDGGMASHQWQTLDATATAAWVERRNRNYATSGLFCEDGNTVQYRRSEAMRTADWNTLRWLEAQLDKLEGGDSWATARELTAAYLALRQAEAYHVRSAALAAALAEWEAAHPGEDRDGWYHTPYGGVAPCNAVETGEGEALRVLDTVWGDLYTPGVEARVAAAYLTVAWGGDGKGPEAQAAVAAAKRLDTWRGDAATVTPQRPRPPRAPRAAVVDNGDW